jgi:hypothetical protein
MPRFPLKEAGVYCFAFVCRSVRWTDGPTRQSVGRRPNGFRVITKERLSLGTSNLV